MDLFAIAQRPLKTKLGKWSLFTTVYIAATVILPNAAIAGNAPVALPDSGSSSLSDTFSPRSRLLNGTAASARISCELTSTLQSLQSSRSVSSIGGKVLPLSAEEIATIVAAVASDRPSADSLQALEQQLTAELNGLDVDISALGLSPSSLAKAIAASNDLVSDLNSEQLADAVESPTFMALLQMLSAANRAVDSDDVATTSNCALTILKMSLR